MKKDQEREPSGSLRLKKKSILDNFLQSFFKIEKVKNS